MNKLLIVPFAVVVFILGAITCSDLPSESILQPINFKPTITSALAQNLKVTEGQAVTIGIKAVGTTQLRYTWYRNGSPIADSIRDSLTVRNTQFTQSGTYKVVVINDFGQDSSKTTLSVDSLFYTITISKSGNGTITPPGVANIVNVHSLATPVFTYGPDSGSHIDSVIVNGANLPTYTSSSQYTFGPINANGTFRVVFGKTAFNLNITTPVNGKILPDSLHNTSLNYGDTATLTAVPDSGFYFGGWGGDTTGSNPILRLILKNDRNISATFVDSNKLSLTATALHGRVNMNPPGGSYSAGTAVKLTAIPDTGYGFTSWSGGATDTKDTITVIMNSSKTVTATFAPITYTLLLTATAGGSVTTPSSPSITVDYGVSTTISATALPNYSFVRWNVDSGAAAIVVPSNQSTSVILTSGNARIQAVFSAKADTLKSLTSFGFVTPAVTGVINDSLKTIAVTVPFGTNTTALTAVFQTTGSSVKVGSTVQTSSSTANNFSSQVIYTVTAADASTRNYTVTVAVAANSAKAMDSFNFVSPAVNGTINESAGTISVAVPYGTNVSSLIAGFSTTGSLVKVGTTVQTSGTTANNFSNAVTYVVTASDGTTKNYVVTVIVGQSTSKTITSFSFITPAATGSINDTTKTISMYVPSGTNLSALVATFSTSGASVKVGSTVQVSGSTANNFTNPLTYIVTAADNTTQNYVVTVRKLYSVLYDGNGSTGVPPSDINMYPQGANVTVAGPGTMSRLGTTFSGWAKLPGGALPYAVGSTLVMDSANVTLYAQWNLISYTITYNLNGGTNTSSPTSYNVTSSAITLPVPTKSGFAFGGWYNDSALISGPVATIPTGTTGNKTFWAKWNQSYTVTYTPNGGSGSVPVDPNRYAQGDSITLLGNTGNLTKSGMNFGGWNDGVRSYAAGSKMAIGSSNISLMVEWSVTSYAITYNLNGGTNTSSPSSYIVTSSTITLPTPAKSGFTFGGWYNDAALTNGPVATIPTGSTGDKIFWAKWTAKILTVTLKKEGGSNGSGSVIVTYGSVMPSANAPTRTGYSFEGYFSTRTGGTQYYTLSMGSSRNWDSENLDTLFAQWTPMAYSVTLDQQSGSGGTSTVTATFEGSMPIALAPSRGAYSFKGYFDATSGGTQYYDSLMISVRNWDKATSTTLYARWTAINYSIIYNLSNGTNAPGNPVTYTIESSNITILAPTRSEFVFAGWYTDALFSTVKSQIPSGTSGTQTFYAKWTWGGGTIIDIDGCGYSTIQIGSQIWTVTNLRTTRFRDGTSLNRVENRVDWETASTAAYCFYDNTTTLSEQEKWGALYNWHAIKNGNLAPPGWRIPTKADWQTLMDYVSVNNGNNCPSIAATSDWTSSGNPGTVGYNLSQNNSSGLALLPGGSRSMNPGSAQSFYSRTTFAHYWTSTEVSTANANMFVMAYNWSSSMISDTDKKQGMHIRLIRE